MTSIHIDDGVVAAGTATLPGWDEGELIARLMSEATHDVLYGEAVANAARHSAQHEP